MTKQCAKCGERKHISSFYAYRTGKDGYSARCKQCWIGDVRSYQARNRDKVLAYERKRSQAKRQREQAIMTTEQARVMKHAMRELFRGEDGERRT